MCPGWRKLPGRCCGVLLLLLVLLLLPLVAPIPTTTYPLGDAANGPQPHYHRYNRQQPRHPLSYPAQRGPRFPYILRPRTRARERRPLLSRRGTDPTYFISTKDSSHSLSPTSPLLLKSLVPPTFPRSPGVAAQSLSLLRNISSTFSPFLDHDLLQNLGKTPAVVPAKGGTSAAEQEESQRNTRSAFGNTTRNFRHHHQVRFQLYSVNAWHLLRLLPNGSIGLTADENDPYTFLRIQPILMQQPYTIRFRSVATGIYLCMSSKGRLYTSCKRSSECEFVSRIEKTFYTTLESKKHPRRYIAIGSDQRIKRARRLRGKPLIEDHFFLELKRPLKATHQVLRKAFPRSAAPLQHCAEYLPAFVRDDAHRPTEGGGVTPLTTPILPVSSTPKVTQLASASTPVLCGRAKAGDPMGTQKRRRGGKGGKNENLDKNCRRRRRRRKRRCKTRRCRERRRRRRKYRKRLRLSGKKKNRRREEEKNHSSNSSKSNNKNSSNSNNGKSDRINSIIGESESLRSNSNIEQRRNSRLYNDNTINNNISNSNYNIDNDNTKKHNDNINSESRSLNEVGKPKPKTLKHLKRGRQKWRGKHPPKTASDPSSAWHRRRHKHRSRASSRGRNPPPSRGDFHPPAVTASPPPEGRSSASSSPRPQGGNPLSPHSFRPFRIPPSSSPFSQLRHLPHKRRRNASFRTRSRGRNAFRLP